MNTLETIEIITDTIEPGGPVHDSAHNLMSTLRRWARHNETTSGENAQIITQYIICLKQFAAMDVEDQWGVEERISHILNSLLLTITSTEN